MPPQPSQKKNKTSPPCQAVAGLGLAGKNSSWPMATPHGPSRLSRLLLFLGICPLLANQAMASNLSANANWTHAAAGGDQTETTQSFSQRYGTQFNTSTTAAIGLSGGVSYNKAWGQGSGSSESSTPNMSMDVHNDIFSANLSGTASKNQPDTGPDTMSQSWQTNWASGWQHKFWPTIQVNYGQSKNIDDAEPRTSDSESNLFGFTTACDLLLAQLYYRYDTNTATNNINFSESTSTSHMAKLNTGRSFWHNKMKVNFSEQYTKNISEFSLQAGAAGPVERDPQWTSSAPVSFTNGAPATTETFAPNFNPTRQVDRIYFTPTPAGAFPTAPTVTIKNALLGTTLATATPTYDSSNNRYQLDITLAVLPAGEAYTVEMTAQVNADTTVTAQAVPITTATGDTYNEKRQTTSQRTDLGITLSLRNDLPFSYNLGLETTKGAAGEKTNSRRQAASLTWKLPRFWTPRLNFSESRNKSDDAPVNISRSYGLSASSSLLPTVDLSLGATQNETLRGGSKISSGNNYTARFSAALYPDLSSDLNLSHATTKNDTTNASTSSWSSVLTMTARLSSKLTADCSINHATSSSSAADGTASSTKSTQGSLSLNARPSELLSVRANVAKQWGDTPSPASYNINTSLTLLRTTKTQLTASYNYAKNTTANHAFSAAWSWALSRYLTLQTNGGYNIADSKNNWNINSQLSSKF